jgi:hypothetical protein
MLKAMYITTITARKVKNIQNYETITAELTAELEQGDDPKKCFEDLLAFTAELSELDPTAIRIAKEDAKKK